MRSHPRSESIYHDRLPPVGLPSDQTLIQKLSQTPLPVQPAALHSSPAVVSALARLPVQLLARLHVTVPGAPSPALWPSQQTSPALAPKLACRHPPLGIPTPAGARSAKRIARRPIASPTSAPARAAQEAELSSPHRRTLPPARPHEPEVIRAGGCST